MIVKYRTSYGNKIEKREILRETKKCVFVKEDIGWANKKGECREAKRATYINWFDTWEEAHSFLLKRAQEGVDFAALRLSALKRALGNIKGMKNPEE